MSALRELKDDSGMTIVETVIASSILLVALLAGFLALDSASSATKGAERQAIAASVGEREVEKMLTLSWSQLAHCPGVPTYQADPLAAAGQVPADPLHYITDGSPPRLQIRANYRVVDSGPLAGTPAAGEELVQPTGTCPAGAIGPAPVPFTAGGVRGSVHRFVTWRADSCPPTLPPYLKGVLAGATSVVDGLLTSINTRLDRIGVNVNVFCSSGRDSKRLTVAVVMAGAAGTGPRKPTWISTIQTDPQGGLVVDTDGRFDF